MAKKLTKKQTGGTAPYNKFVGDSIMTKQSKKLHPEKWEPKIFTPKGIDTTIAKKLLTTKKKLSKAQTGGGMIDNQPYLIQTMENYAGNNSKPGIVKKVKEKVGNIKEKVKATLKKSKKPSRYETYQNARFLD